MAVDAVSIWGASLSTALAVWKGVDAWRNRARLETNYAFTTREDGGNSVTLMNLSSKPLIVRYWDVAWVPRQGGEGNVAAGPDPDELEGGRFRVAPHDVERLSLDDPSSAGTFDWSDKASAGMRLWLRIVVAGRARVKLMVYDPERD